MQNVGKFKRWCFTSFGERPGWWPDVMQYIVYQKEKCPDSGREHWQGYVEFKDAKRLTRVKYWLGLTHADEGRQFHVSRAAGSAQANKIYCTKEESRIEEGSEYGKAFVSQQGRRIDIELLRDDALDDSKTEYDVATTNLAWFRHHKAFNRLRGMHGRRKASTQGYDRRRITWYWGPPGTGKSRRAAYEAGTADGGCFRKSSDTKWFDGYDGEHNVIIDDIDGNAGMSVGTWKRILDGYPEQVEVKNGFTPWLARRIWITSNHSPEAWIHGIAKSMVDQEALLRRINDTVYMDGQWIPIPPPNPIEPVPEPAAEMDKEEWACENCGTIHGEYDDCKDVP